MKLSLCSLFRSQHGSTSVMFAIASVPVFLAVGAAVDYLHHTHTVTALQAAADAASLAGVSQVDKPENAIRTAKAFLDRQVKLPAGVSSSITVKDGIIETRITGKTATAFMSLAGITSMNVDVSSRAAAGGGRGMEVVLVLDVSGSMSGEIPSLRAAATQLLDEIYGTSDTRPNTYVGIVPFAGRVNVISYGTSWITGKPRQADKETAAVGTSCKVSTLNVNYPKLCTNHRSFPNSESDAPPSSEMFTEYTTSNLVCPVNKAIALTASRSVLQNTVNNLCAGHGTSTEVGMVWGWRMISENWQGRWGDPNLPMSNSKSPGKYVVIMTDGKNHPNQSGDTYSEAEADARLLRECSNMKAQGITVLAVTFNMGGTLKSLYGKCVSKPEYNYTAEDGAELKSVFSTIGQTIGKGGSIRLLN